MRIKFTDLMLDILNEKYPNTPTHLLAKELGISINSVYRKSNALGLKKSEEYKNSPFSGRLRPGTNIGGNTKFQKGNVPFNKGKKMNPETYSKVSKTMFKKGNKPHNTKEIGRINKRIDNTGIPYLYIKISDSNWQLLHRVIWQLYNGDIPEKMKITFIDGNSLNCQINNLQMVSYADLMRKNSHRNIPKELLEVIKLKNKLISKINSYGKK
jgi:hypothetical protein